MDLYQLQYFYVPVSPLFIGEWNTTTKPRPRHQSSTDKPIKILWIKTKLYSSRNLGPVGPQKDQILLLEYVTSTLPANLFLKGLQLASILNNEPY